MSILVKLRNSRGWTQTVLSEKSGVSQNYISELELGKKQPTVKVLKKLSGALGVPIATLIE